MNVMNVIIMSVGKSRLIEGLSKGDTLVVDIGEARSPQAALSYIPNVYIAHYESFYDVNIGDELSRMVEFDKVIFYSYLSYAQYKNESRGISGFLGNDKCVFMFSKE